MSAKIRGGFEAAGVRLHLPRRPLLPVMPHAFQITVQRDAADERVAIWPGAEANVVEVLSIDCAFRQVVLRVREAPQRVEERMRRTPEAGATVLGRRGRNWIVERWTAPVERRLLCGADPSHLFVAHVPSGDTVRETHEALRPREVVDAEARWPGSTVRQGEWFFVRLSPPELETVRSIAATWPNLRRREAIAWQGRPHVAEELVRLPGDRDPRSGDRLARSFVRGRVWHDDHRTVSFDAWRRVILNAEVRLQSRRADLYGRARSWGLQWRD
jgi:hypothetical protein